MRWLLRLLVPASVIRLSSHKWLAITWNCKNQNYRHLFGPLWLLDTHWLLPLVVAASMLGCSPMQAKESRGDGSGGKGIPYTDQICVRPGDE